MVLVFDFILIFRKKSHLIASKCRRGEIYPHFILEMIWYFCFNKVVHEKFIYLDMLPPIIYGPYTHKGISVMNFIA